MILSSKFFNRDAQKVARELLGKILRVKYDKIWLSARIVETEAYYIHDKASHASLGYTKKRQAMFMPAGTIYMYHSRGGPSLNVSCRGRGNAVLIKSALPYLEPTHSKKFRQNMFKTMQKLNPQKNSPLPRSLKKLCAGQALLCKSLGLTIESWDKKQFDPKLFYIEDIGMKINNIIQTRRLGIPKGRDEHLPYRFVDPLSKRKNELMELMQYE